MDELLYEKILSGEISLEVDESIINEKTLEEIAIKQNALTDSYNPFLSRRTYAKFDYIKILFKERFFLNK